VTCPTNDAGVTCSRHGECGTDGRCDCYAQYEGDACESLIVKTTTSINGGVGGFGSNLDVPDTPEQIQLGGLVKLPPTTSPTASPTMAPTREPLVVPVVEARVSFSGVTREDFTKKNDDGISLEDILLNQIAKTMNVDTSTVKIISIDIEQRRERHLLAPGDLIIVMEIRKPEAAAEAGFSLESFQAEVLESLESFDTAVVETFVVENINADATMGSVEAAVSEILVPNTDTPTLAPTGTPTDEPTGTPTGEPTDEPITDEPIDEPITDEPIDEPIDEPTTKPTDDSEEFPITDEPTDEPINEPSSGSQVGPSQLLKIWAVYGACVALYSVLSGTAAAY